MPGLQHKPAKRYWMLRNSRHAGVHSETDDHNINAACQVVQVLQSWTTYIHHSCNIVRVQAESWNITEKNSLVQQAFAKHTQWKLNTRKQVTGYNKAKSEMFLTVIKPAYRNIGWQLFVLHVNMAYAWLVSLIPRWLSPWMRFGLHFSLTGGAQLRPHIICPLVQQDKHTCFRTR